MSKKKGYYDKDLQFAPTKAALQKMEYSAKRAGSAANPKANNEKWDWNAGKLDSAQRYQKF